MLTARERMGKRETDGEEIKRVRDMGTKWKYNLIKGCYICRPLTVVHIDNNASFHRHDNKVTYSGTQKSESRLH